MPAKIFGRMDNCVAAWSQLLAMIPDSISYSNLSAAGRALIVLVWCYFACSMRRHSAGALHGYVTIVPTPEPYKNLLGLLNH